MFCGSLVAIVTPMTADGALDLPAWDRLLDFHMREGSDGIIVGGTTGESAVLSAAEVEELTCRAVARCREKLKVIVGAGSNSTDATIASTRSLSRLGVDAAQQLHDALAALALPPDPCGGDFTATLHFTTPDGASDYPQAECLVGFSGVRDALDAAAQ